MKADKKLLNVLFIISVLTAVLSATILIIYFLPQKAEEPFFNPIPTVTIETPAKRSRTDQNEFCVKVSANSFESGTFPAASFSISFDKEKLEFLGIENGSVIADNNDSSAKWNFDADFSNESGKINVMYLDTTGGKYAFNNSFLNESENILFTLKFRLRETVENGDIIELSFDDAVFASNDEKNSLSLISKTLKTKNGRIVIGD